MSERRWSSTPTPEVLAQAVAARLVVAAARRPGRPRRVRVGGADRRADRRRGLPRRCARAPARDAVDWSRVDVWWGDERFLPAGDPDRNETQAREALLDALPLDPARVHPMPAVGRAGRRRPGGGRRPVRRGAGRAPPGPGTAALPHFDVLLLGVGEDGHVASVFPEHPVGLRDAAGVGGAGQPEAAAGADHADPAGDQHGRGGVADRRRRRTRPARWGWRWPAPGRCSCRPPACAAWSRTLWLLDRRGARGRACRRSLRSLR